jgi:hypothetical protein
MSNGGSQKPSLTLVTQPQDYFRELVTDALGRQKIAAQPETEFYLVNLLNQFITTDRLYPRDAQGVLREEPLAFLVKEALEEPLPQAQRALFRQIGDVSLYVAGYFQESLNRKLVDLDYYIGVGGIAYRHVAARVEEDPMRALYAELADKFARFVDVLAEVSDKTTPRSEKDLLRLYDVWVRTRSERAARALQEAGILPNETVKKDWQ